MKKGIEHLIQLNGDAVTKDHGRISLLMEDASATESEIDAEVIRLQAAYDASDYARNRAAEYPSQGDQNDMIYKDIKNSTTTHADAVEAVKTKWPKDNSGPIG